MNVLLTALTLLPSFCNFWAGSPDVVSTVGDSITVASGGQSYAANGGWGTWDVLHPNRWPEPPCSDITPLQCEYDVTQPRISLIQIGTNDSPIWSETWFSQNNIKAIVDYTVGRGILPLLYTLPHNINKDVSVLNEYIRELVATYGIPLIDYNKWLETLPNMGISPDGVHPDENGLELRKLLTEQRLEGIYATCGW